MKTDMLLGAILEIMTVKTWTHPEDIDDYIVNYLGYRVEKEVIDKTSFFSSYYRAELTKTTESYKIVRPDGSIANSFYYEYV